MTQLALFLARTAISAWIGAAVLFVVVGVSEVLHPEFTSEIKDQLVLIRFPWFYRFGFTLLAVCLLATLAVSPGAEFSAKRRILAAWLLAAALVLMAVEYFAVYLPLAQLVTPPGKPRTAEFQAYHKASMAVNLTGLALCGAAMIIINRPAQPAASASRPDNRSRGLP